MTNTRHDGDFRRLAAQIWQIASGVVQAHEDGHGPGAMETVPVRQAVGMVLECVPGEMAANAASVLGHHYRYTGLRLLARGAPEGLAEEWVIFVETVRKAADELLLFAANNKEATGFDTGEADTDPVRVMAQIGGSFHPRFDRLAELVTLDVATRMVEVTGRIERALTPAPETNPLSLAERRMLEAIVAGETIDQVADQMGVSTRTIHRRLQTIWTRIGASSRTEGIALVSIRGWLG